MHVQHPRPEASRRISRSTSRSRRRRRGVVALFGRSGCGKTTLVNIVAGLLDADAARIEIGGVSLEDTLRECIACLPSGDASATCFRTRACFRISTCSAICATANVARAARAQRSHHARSGRRVAGPGGAAATPRALSCPAANVSASHWVERCCPSRGCCCSMSRWPRSMPRAAKKCCRTSRGCATNSRFRSIYVSHQFEEVLRLATHVVLLDHGRVAAQGALEAGEPASGTARDRRSGCGRRGVCRARSSRGRRHDGLAAVRVGDGVLNVGSARRARRCATCACSCSRVTSSSPLRAPRG